MATRSTCELSSLRRSPADKSHDGTVDLCSTRMHRLTVQYEDDHRLFGVFETSLSPASRHSISLPTPLVLRGGDLEATISAAYLTSEGATPAEGQDFVARILSFLDDLLVGDADEGFKVCAELKFITDEVVWMGRPGNWDEEVISRVRAQKEKKEVVSNVVHYDPGACTICLDDLVTRNCNLRHRTNLSCKHKFHSLCIVRWLQTSPTCPICRREFGPKYCRSLADFSFC